MPSELNQLKINKFVLHKQRLTGKKEDESLVETVRAIGGLHATSATTPYLSLFARVENFRREQLDTELYAKRNLGKIRYVRTTVYVLPKDMIPTAFAATRMMTEPASQAYSKFLGITKKQYTETSMQILEILKGKKGLTTKQIKQQLQTTLNVSPIVNLMCDQGLLIRGAPEKGWKSNMHTYHLINEYFPDLELNAANEKDAKKTVVRQYLASFAPVTENDVSWWTGFTKGQVKQILAELHDEITYVTVSGIDKAFIVPSQEEAALMATKATGKHVVNILPSLDPYMMGFKDRERYLDSACHSYVFDRGGNATTTILLDGKVIGIWDFEDPFIKVFLFDRAEADVLKEIQVKARSVGTFISGKEEKIKECASMIPLTQRTAGGVMSPLKGS
jgi:uncharacterized protein YcaQ